MNLKADVRWCPVFSDGSVLLRSSSSRIDGFCHCIPSEISASHFVLLIDTLTLYVERRPREACTTLQNEVGRLQVLL